MDALKKFPEDSLNQISREADGVFNLFNQILEFDPDSGDLASRREQLTSQIEGQYQPLFTIFMPYISYAVARTVNWKQLQSDGRAAVQSVKDQADGVMKEIDMISQSVARVLSEVREVAAEQGVTQQAKYFETESMDHLSEARKWRKAAITMSVVVFFVCRFNSIFPFHTFSEWRYSCRGGAANYQ